MNITETRIEYELQEKCTEEIHEECNDKIVPECKEICPNADDQQCPISIMDQDCSGAVSDCWTPGTYYFFFFTFCKKKKDQNLLFTSV